MNDLQQEIWMYRPERTELERINLKWLQRTVANCLVPCRKIYSQNNLKL